MVEQSLEAGSGCGWVALDAGGTRFAGTIEEAQAEFARTRALVCHDLLDATLWARLNRICDAATFVADRVDELGNRTIEHPATAGNAIALMLRRQPLFDWLEQVTGCATIRTIEGRVVETRVAPDDQLRWHNDIQPGRVLAVTIALGTKPYSGGDFEMRRAGSMLPLINFRHDRPGTALIFEVSPLNEHRLTPLTAGGPRRVFAGWFMQ